MTINAAVKVLLEAGYGVALLPRPGRPELRIDTYGLLLPGGCSEETKLLFANKLISSVIDPYSAEEREEDDDD